MKFQFSSEFRNFMKYAHDKFSDYWDFIDNLIDILEGLNHFQEQESLKQSFYQDIWISYLENDIWVADRHLTRNSGVIEGNHIFTKDTGFIVRSYDFDLRIYFSWKQSDIIDLLYFEKVKSASLNRTKISTTKMNYEDIKSNFTDKEYDIGFKINTFEIGSLQERIQEENKELSGLGFNIPFYCLDKDMFKEFSVRGDCFNFATLWTCYYLSKNLQ